MNYNKRNDQIIVVEVIIAGAGNSPKEAYLKSGMVYNKKKKF